MRKLILSVLFILVSIPVCIADDSNPLLESYLRNFARASVATKTQILQDASAADPQSMGPLYKEAVDFILTNNHLLDTDPAVQELALLSAKYTGQAGYAGANHLLWELFQVNKDTTLRVEILMSLGETAREDDQLIESLNQFLKDENSRYLSGVRIDRQVLAVCVIVLGKLQHPSSFPVLFTTKIIDHTDIITGYAEKSLSSIEGNFKELMISVIRQNAIPEKLDGLQFALASPRLSDEEKGEVAVAALEAGLSTGSPDAVEMEVLQQLRYESVRALTERQWTQALGLVIDNFEQAALEYDRGMTDTSFFLAAINSLGAMRAHEAAERLTLYLGLLNSYTEGGQKVDEQIALTVINNLGMLGDQIAGDNLLFVAFIDYSDAVKQAAREAFKNLKRR